MAELPLHYREILLLCDLEEMSYREISETLAIPLGTVMSRLSRTGNITELVRWRLEGGTVNGLRDLEDTTRFLH
jgi:Sigma-70, region 4